jgi:hypothetical protein
MVLELRLPIIAGFSEIPISIAIANKVGMSASQPHGMPSPISKENDTHGTYSILGSAAQSIVRASIVREKLGEIPFSWRLPSFELVGMTTEDVKKWVINAFKDGASEVYLVVEPILCDEKNSRKVLEFMKVAKEIKTSKLVF